MRITATKERHDDCCPGSANWCDYYEALNKKDKKQTGLAGELLYKNARGKNA